LEFSGDAPGNGAKLAEAQGRPIEGDAYHRFSVTSRRGSTVLATTIEDNFKIMELSRLQCKSCFTSQPLVSSQPTFKVMNLHTRVHRTFDLSLASGKLPHVVAMEDRIVLKDNVPFSLTHVRRMAEI
jgi:hypothetical protein